MEYLIWPDTIKKAKDIQEKLKKHVRIVPLRNPPDYIAGVDAAFFDKKAIGIVCVYKYPEIVFLEFAFSIKDTDFPYVPGYLSFREGPVIIETLKKLKIVPNVIIFDGQGIAHPMNLGIASHIGLIINKPTIGCAKTKLIGEYDEPGLKKGDWTPLNYKSKIVGAVLRTRNNVKPIYVSPGHLIDLNDSIEIVLKCSGKYRIPEPLRKADILSKEIKKNYKTTWLSRTCHRVK